MKLCKYWAKAEATGEDATGKRIRLCKWGGSNETMAEATAAADAALEALKRKLRDIKLDGWDKGYTYSLRDVPEELITRFSDSSGITRNARGCLVLNTADAAFVDIDLPREGFFSKLFGGSREKREQAAMAGLADWLAAHPGAGVRVYRTAGGLRYLFTHKPLPVNDETLGWLRDLKSDKLYVLMCRNQNCYRARLTPKPYRVRCGRLSSHYPFTTPETQRAFADWLRNYEAACSDVATCAYVQTLGETRIHPDVAVVVKEHDRLSKAESGLPLA